MQRYGVATSNTNAAASELNRIIQRMIDASVSTALKQHDRREH